MGPSNTSRSGTSVSSRRTASSPPGKRPKNYVVDTNVLLHDPNALLNFEENHVLLPIEVIKSEDPPSDRYEQCQTQDREHDWPEAPRIEERNL